MTPTDPVDPAASPRSLRPVGIAGWLATVVIFASLFLMTGHGTAEPDFDAPAAEIQRYLETRTAGLFAVGASLFVVGLCALLWFFCGLSAALRRHAAGPEWLPGVVAASGTAAVAVLLLGTQEAAVFRVDDGVDAQISRFAFDLGSVGFANAWVTLGSIGIASGWAILATRPDPADPSGSGGSDRSGGSGWPRWLGWWVLAAGVGLVLARPFWTTYAWLIPYALFWTWVLTVSTRMLEVRGSTRRRTPQPPGLRSNTSSAS
ncbi:MAG TPA: hypothetical protein VFH03_09885 [Actinoplanes sp.]|nr:hypothetical protein [Actinoplanes sp.]